MKKTILFILAVVLFLVFWYMRPSFLETISSSSLPPQIVIDVGHGGNDPGKVGINQSLEKDINLSIGRALSRYLSSAGYRVLMTRETDISLADQDASNQKLSDFKNRAAMIKKSSPMAVISIHQNSYPDETVSGTQVFYSQNEYSKLLAGHIQDQCIRILAPQKIRQIKPNNDYYLFRHVDCPIVIVECGFLSNRKEASLLSTKEYQEKTAWAISMGTIGFLKELE